MFWPDVISLRSFYLSPLGEVTQDLLRRSIRRLWPEAPNETILGLGYAAPFLLSYLERADVVAAAMPAGMGVVHWPQTRPNLSVLVEETQLPFATGTVNRVLMIHAMEHSERLRAMLEEARRVLTPSGRLLIIVPNRTGSWVRLAASPFASGHPFISWQLRSLLQESRFTPLATQHCLFFPPNASRFMLKWAGLIERIGRRLFPGLGGVVMVEAEKQVYAASGGKRATVPAYAAPALAR